MRFDQNKIEAITQKQDEFSGVVYVEKNRKVAFHKGYGLANKRYGILNKEDTKFGMASGCKLFTAIAICQLVDKGKITFDTKLKDCLSIPFKNYDPNITIHHLLTHSSGIGDYFDEEVMDDFSDLWKERPMYNIKSPKDFLEMFQNMKMEFSPGSKFKYNNAGFIVLGLIIEELTGMSFAEYIKENVFNPCNMLDTGYFPLNKLPKNTASGYIKEESGEWETNIYSIPIIGGPDGGAFTTAKDLSNLWHSILEYKVISKDLTKEMLKPHIQVNGDFYYGYGVWILKNNNDIFKYYVMGEDPGVSMMSSMYVNEDTIVTILGNSELGTWGIAREIQDLIKNNM